MRVRRDSPDRRYSLCILDSRPLTDECRLFILEAVPHDVMLVTDICCYPMICHNIHCTSDRRDIRCLFIFGCDAPHRRFQNNMNNEILLTDVILRVAWNPCP